MPKNNKGFKVLVVAYHLITIPDALNVKDAEKQALRIAKSYNNVVKVEKPCIAMKWQKPTS